MITLPPVDFLVSAGVEINKTDGRGLTPLHLAAYKGHRHIMNQLISYGADRKVLDPTGLTAEQIFEARWRENYRNKWFITRWFSDPKPPELELQPYNLQQLIDKKNKI